MKFIQQMFILFSIQTESEFYETLINIKKKEENFCMASKSQTKSFAYKSHLIMDSFLSNDHSNLIKYYYHSFAKGIPFLTKGKTLRLRAKLIC